eukprot:SAG22_NODE_1312_length_4776_cov_2.886466_8_plen_87_part_00
MADDARSSWSDLASSGDESDLASSGDESDLAVKYSPNTVSRIQLGRKKFEQFKERKYGGAGSSVGGSPAVPELQCVVLNYSGLKQD